MNIHSDVFIYEDDDAEFTLHKLERTQNLDGKDRWVLRIGNLGIFMREEHIKKILDLIGQEFWNFESLELADPEEECCE